MHAIVKSENSIPGCILSRSPPRNSEEQENITPVKIEPRVPLSPPIYPMQPFAHSTPVFPKYSRHSITELLEKPITPIGQLRTLAFHSDAERIQFPLQQNQFPLQQNQFPCLEKKDELLDHLEESTNETDRNQSPTFSSSPTSANSSPDSCEGVAKKKSNRTNYTPIQVRALEQVFLETPYPDADIMEQLSVDLNIQEQKLKVWFQNKRARSKKRMIDNKFQNYPPIHPFYLQHMPHLMTSQLNSYAAPGATPGFFPYPGPPSAPMMPPHMSMFPFPYMFSQPPQQQ